MTRTDPTARADTAARVLHDLSARHQIPGLGAAVILNGRVALEFETGFADVQHRRPVTRDTMFQLASLTKPFTAAGVLLLAAGGHLGLDDRIQRHLQGVPDAWSGVTVRHLLTQTSGLPDYLSAPLWALPSVRTPDDLLRVAPLPTAAPGVRWEYSNTNYLLLGLLIEALTGQRYDAFLTQSVFDRAGMSRTRRHDPAGPDEDARGYEWVNGALAECRPLDPVVWDNADGGLASCLRDLVAWDAALDLGDPVGHAVLEQAWTPARLADGSQCGYGFGWFVAKLPNGRVTWHDGARPGASANFARFQVGGERLTVIILCNHRGPTTPLAWAVAHAFLDVPSTSVPVFGRVPPQDPGI